MTYFSRIPLPLKKFNIVVGQTDAEGSPPPPPAPSGPIAPQERFLADSQFSIGDSYSGATSYASASASSPQMAAYYTKRYSSEPTSAMPRYTSSYQPQQQQQQQQQQHSYSTVQQPGTDLSSYYTGRYTDYTSRYPTYGGATTPEATSPGTSTTRVNIIVIK